MLSMVAGLIKGNDHFSMSLRKSNVQLFLKWAKIVFEFLNADAIHDRLAGKARQNGGRLTLVSYRRNSYERVWSMYPDVG